MEKNAETTALVKQETVALGAIIAATTDRIASISTVGDWVARSGMFGCNTAEAGRMIAIQCVEEGLKISEWPRTYHLINGRPQKRAHAAQAEFERLGGVVEWTELGRDGKRAAATMSYPGKKPLNIEFTIEQAQRAGLVKSEGNWDKWPDRMLRAAVLREGVLLLAPKVYAGIYDDGDAVPGPALNLAPEPKPATVSEVVTAPPAATEARTVEVEVVKEAPRTPPQQPAQAAKPTQTATPAPAAPAQQKPELSRELQSQVMAVIGEKPENMTKALAFFRAQRWIGADEGPELLPEARAREVIARAPHFQSKVLGGKP
jgi:hypothetical protein